MVVLLYFVTNFKTHKNEELLYLDGMTFHLCLCNYIDPRESAQ